MTKLLIIGGNGLVGSRVVELLSERYDFEKISRETGIDITKKEEVLNNFRQSSAEFVINMAAKADVDGCEADKASDEISLSNGVTVWEGLESAYAVNAYGSRNVAEAAAQTNKKIIHISTDFVFNGQKEDPYLEDDKGDPINWYGKTKYFGEEEVRKYENYVIARIAYPYRLVFPKKDFVRSIISRFESGGDVQAVRDHVMTPTFVDDIAYALDEIISKDLSGIYHVVGSSFVSPLEVAHKIANIFNFDISKIKETTRANFFEERAPRPFHLALKNDKIAELGIKMSTFDEGLLKIKNQ